MSLNISDVIAFVAGSTSPVSSKEVAAHFGKVHAGISHLMAELVGAGVLKMVGTRKAVPARRGRPEFLFEAVSGVESPLADLADYRANVSAAKKAMAPSEVTEPAPVEPAPEVTEPAPVEVAVAVDPPADFFQP